MRPSLQEERRTMSDTNEKLPRREEPDIEKDLTWRHDSPRRRRISPHSNTSSEAEEEKQKMWKELKQQIHAERELTKMQLNDLRQELRETQQQLQQSLASRTQQRHEETEEETRPPRHHRAHPYPRRTFSTQVQRMDFTQTAHTGRVNNLSMLPHNEFVIDNLKQEITREEEQLNNQLINIDLHEASMTEEQAENNPLLQRLKDAYITGAEKLAYKKAQIQKAQTVASSYSSNLEMPSYSRPPRDYTAPRDVLDPTKIIKTISIFDDEDQKSRHFRHVWTKILQYGKKHYLNEQEHKEVLGATLWGNSLEDFNRLDATGSTLKDIVDNLAKIYDKTPSIDDHRTEVDNFIRKKGESISQAMARATTLIHKLRPMSTEGGWPETRDNMRKSILKQIVQTATKSHLNYEESKMLSSGGICNIDSLIQIAHQYEQAMGKMPEKEIATAYQTASFAPKYTAPEMKKIQSTMDKGTKQENENNKSEQPTDKIEKLISLMTNQMELQTKTYDKMSKQYDRVNNQGKDTSSRNYSRNNSQNRNKDSRQRSNSRNRDNSQNRNSSRGRSNSRNRQQSSVTFTTPRGRSRDRGNNSNRNRPETPSRSQDRGRSRSRENTGNQKAPSNIKMIEGQFAYFCNPCAANHLANNVCAEYQKWQSENL